MREKRTEGKNWLIAQAVLVLAVLFCPHPTDQWLPIGPLAYLLVALTLIGLTLLFSGVAQLGKDLTAFPKPNEHAELKITGLYRYMRHPMYSGAIIAHTSFAILEDNPYRLLLNIFVVLFFEIKARKEEGYLRNIYSNYAQYQQRTKRFLPYIY